MAYLTAFTYSKLCRKIDVRKEIDMNLFCEHIYNDPQIFLMLNKTEVKYLFNYKSILEDENKYVVEYYQKVPEREDHHNYVFERAGKLKYHTDRDCVFLKKDYIDFRIPEDIKSIGSEAVKEYRTWFKQKGYAEQYFAGTLDRAKMTFEYNTYFPPRFPGLKPLNENYELVVEIPNSDSNFSEKEFDMILFQQTLEQLKDGFSNIFSSPVLRTLSKFQYLEKRSDIEIIQILGEIFSPEFAKNYGIENIRKKLAYSRTIKFELIKTLLDYFKWTCKLSSKNFDIISLEKFGLECCSACKKEKQK